MWASVFIAVELEQGGDEGIPFVSHHRGRSVCSHKQKSVSCKFLCVVPMRYSQRHSLMGIQDRDGKQKYFHRVKVQFFSQLSPFCIWKLNPLSAFVLFILVQMSGKRGISLSEKEWGRGLLLFHGV